MAKMIENYKIEAFQLTNKDGVDFFKAKQIGSDKAFTLKRLTANRNFNIQDSTKYELSVSQQQLFDKLLHQTKILNNLKNQNIPKCIKILKTNNNIYLVYQYHPTNTLEDYLKKSRLKFSTKIELCRILTSTLQYIHSQKIAYRNLNTKNILIGKKGNAFFTNFTQSLILQKDQKFQKLEEYQKHKIQNSFQKILETDILDLAHIFDQIFQFSKASTNINVFSCNLEKDIFIMTKKILSKQKPIMSINDIKNILNQKYSFYQTECTQCPQSPKIMPVLQKRFKSPSPIKIRTSAKQHCRSNSAVKLYTEIVKSPYKYQHNTPTPPSIRISQKSARTSRNTAFETQSQNNQIFSQLNGSEFKLMKQRIQSIIKKRLCIVFLLKCTQFLSQSQPNIPLKLIYVLTLKATEISSNLKEDMEQCNKNVEACSQPKIKEFFGILKLQELFYKEFTTNISSLMMRNNNEDLKKWKIQQNYGIQFQEIINSLICQFLEKFLFKELNQNPLPSFFTYHDVKMCYYLSIKLKYNFYQKFFDKKLNSNIQLNLLDNNYFETFQKCTVPKESMIQEIKLRIIRFKKYELIKGLQYKSHQKMQQNSPK